MNMVHSMYADLRVSSADYNEEEEGNTLKFTGFSKGNGNTNMS